MCLCSCSFPSALVPCICLFLFGRLQCIIHEFEQEVWGSLAGPPKCCSKIIDKVHTKGLQQHPWWEHCTGSMWVLGFRSRFWCWGSQLWETRLLLIYKYIYTPVKPLRSLDHDLLEISDTRQKTEGDVTGVSTKMLGSAELTSNKYQSYQPIALVLLIHKRRLRWMRRETSALSLILLPTIERSLIPKETWHGIEKINRKWTWVFFKEMFKMISWSWQIKTQYVKGIRM